MKICSGCKIEKDENEFSKDKRAKSGLQSACKRCNKEWRQNNKEYRKEKNKEYYLNNKDHLKEYQEEYRENNPEKIKEYREDNKEHIKQKSKEYQQNNKEEIAVQRHEYYLENIGRKKEYDKQWRKNNPDKVLERDVKRRNLMIENTIIPFTAEQLDQRLSLWGGYCCYCGEAFSTDNPMHRDHVIPLSRGGMHCLANIRPACRKCNLSKSDKSLNEWLKPVNTNSK